MSKSLTYSNSRCDSEGHMQQIFYDCTPCFNAFHQRLNGIKVCVIIHLKVASYEINYRYRFKVGLVTRMG